MPELREPTMIAANKSGGASGLVSRQESVSIAAGGRVPLSHTRQHTQLEAFYRILARRMTVQVQGRPLPRLTRKRIATSCHH